MIGNRICNAWSDGMLFGVLGVSGVFSHVLSCVKK